MQKISSESAIKFNSRGVFSCSVCGTGGNWESVHSDFYRKAAFSRLEDNGLTDHSGNVFNRSGFALGLKLLLETHLKLQCRQGLGGYITAHVFCASLERSPSRPPHMRMSRRSPLQPLLPTSVLFLLLLHLSTSGHHLQLTLLMLQFHRFLVYN